MTTRSIVAAAVLLSACGGDTVEDSTLVRTDSAGVDLVEVPLAHLEAPGPVVDASPTLVIGGGNTTDEAYLFDRIDRARRLSDGRIVIVNANDQQIRIYDPSGQHRVTLGGRGGGPGEFRYIVDIAERGDTLLVTGVAKRAWLSASGEVHRTEPLDWTPLTESLQGGGFIGSGMPLSDGGYLLNAELRWEPEGLGRVVRPDRPIFRTPSSLDRVDTLGIYPGLEQIDIGTAERPDYRTLPYGARTSMAFGGSPSLIYLASNEDTDIDQFDASGRLTRIIRVPKPRRPIGQADVDAWWDEFASAMQGQRGFDEAQFRAGTSRVPAPDSMSAYGVMVVARDGSLWVDSDPSSVRMFEASSYWVFARDGAPVGSVELPSGLRILEIGEDYLLAAARDSLDVETLQLHALSPAR